MTVSRFKAKANPTNKDLQDQQAEMHDCLHNVGFRVDMLARALGVQLPSPEEMERGVQPIVRARMGSMKPWHVVIAVVPAIVGSLGIYRVAEPAVIAFFVALRHALLTVHL